jgi:Fe-S-cluster-containing dehydrogenase component
MSVRWGMVIDLDKCTGCQECTIACKEENNVPYGSPAEQSHRQSPFWHKVIAATEGEYPSANTEMIPMPCMHCDNPPCVMVCPAKATFKRKDGIVIQNYRRCIGCKYCMVACPYGARSYNYKEQEDKEYQRVDPPLRQDLIGCWPFPHRAHGMVEKCTFCFQRIEQATMEGKEIGTEVVTACVEACPAHARAFGNLDDPNSEVSKLISNRDAIRLREGMGTSPKVYYLTK